MKQKDQSRNHPIQKPSLEIHCTPLRSLRCVITLNSQRKVTTEKQEINKDLEVEESSTSLLPYQQILSKSKYLL